MPECEQNPVAIYRRGRLVMVYPCHACTSKLIRELNHTDQAQNFLVCSRIDHLSQSFVTNSLLPQTCASEFRVWNACGRPNPNSSRQNLVGGNEGPCFPLSSLLICVVLTHADGIRPVLNTSQTVVVRFGFALLQILDFDTDTGELHIRTWERFVRVTIFRFFLGCSFVQFCMPFSCSKTIDNFVP